MNLTPDLLTRIIQGTSRHNAYTITKELYEKLKIHFDGTTPKILIDQFRPNESQTIKDYRVANHRAKTKGPCNKIVSSLSKIRRSQDWIIDYDEKNLPANIKLEETPRIYFEKNYPKHGSLTNWMFSVGLKNYLIDANAIVFVFPLNTAGSKSEYLKPESFIFNSDKVVGYSEDEYCVLKGISEAEYDLNGIKLRDKLVYWVVDTERVQRLEQVNGGTDFNVVLDYPHGLGYLPAFKVRGQYCESIDSDTVWESRLSSIIPDFDQALMTFSDFIAELVQHIHSEKWQYTTNSCSTCNGTGKEIRRVAGLTTAKTETVPCTKCSGGKIPVSSYGNIQIDMNLMKEFSGIPTPPVGYLMKDVNVIKELDRLVDKFIDSGLSSINMEFLSLTPLVESGKAKEVDKDELNNFVHSIAEDIVYIMERITSISMDYRYKIVVPNENERKRIAPKINVPEKFDLLGSQYFVDEYGKLNTAGMSPCILVPLQKDIASKKFYNDPQVAKRVSTIFELDPLPGITTDEKMTMLSNKGISYKDFIISCNISHFVDMAISKYPEKESAKPFLEMDIEEKEKIISDYAEQKAKEISTAEGLIKDLIPAPADPTNAV